MLELWLSFVSPFSPQNQLINNLLKARTSINYAHSHNIKIIKFKTTSLTARADFFGNLWAKYALKSFFSHRRKNFFYCSKESKIQFFWCIMICLPSSKRWQWGVLYDSRELEKTHKSFLITFFFRFSLLSWPIIKDKKSSKRFLRFFCPQTSIYAKWALCKRQLKVIIIFISRATKRVIVVLHKALRPLPIGTIWKWKILILCLLMVFHLSIVIITQRARKNASVAGKSVKSLKGKLQRAMERWMMLAIAMGIKRSCYGPLLSEDE